MGITGITLPLGIPEGIATLNSNGHVPFSQLDFTALDFKGLWNASSNTPALADNTGSNGDLYIVATSGTRNLGSGSVSFVQGNIIIHDSTKWVQVGDIVDFSDFYTKEESDALYSSISSISNVGFSGLFEDLLNKPVFSLVATSGSYNDLTNKPTVPVLSGGSYSTTGIALQTAYVIPHGLGYNPQHMGITPTSLGASGISYCSWDGTNLIVNFVAEPGIVSIYLHWFSIK